MSAHSLSSSPVSGSPRRRRRRVVVAVAAALALAAVAVAIPARFGEDINANESAAIAVLKMVSSAQAQLQACAAKDADGNGAGEYGYFAELAGVLPVHSPAAPPDGARLAPPVLAPRFAAVVDGCVRIGGYRFRMYLRGPGGAWVPEAGAGGPGGAPIDTAAAELEWLCYAWPIEAGRTGKRAFVINQGGDVLMTNMDGERYSGATAPPPGTAGFRANAAPPPPGAGGSCPSVAPSMAANTVDSCGNRWLVV